MRIKCDSTWKAFGTVPGTFGTRYMLALITIYIFYFLWFFNLITPLLYLVMKVTHL